MYVRIPPCAYALLLRCASWGLARRHRRRRRRRRRVRGFTASAWWDGDEDGISVLRIVIWGCFLTSAHQGDTPLADSPVLFALQRDRQCRRSCQDEMEHVVWLWGSSTVIEPPVVPRKLPTLYPRKEEWGTSSPFLARLLPDLESSFPVSTL